MKTFLFRILFFLSPIILLFAFTWIFYSTNKGDLLRTGYIMDIYPHYRDIFKNEFDRKIFFTKISEINFKIKNDYLVLTLGDSFSEQGCYGYKNYLAENENIDLIHFDLRNENQIQVLFSLLNGDFFSLLNIKFVLLQFTERNILNRMNDTDTSQTLTCDQLSEWSEKEKINFLKKDSSYKFPSDRIIKFPYYNLRYLIKKDTCYSISYRTTISSNLFSVNNNELLFYGDDLSAVEQNNKAKNVNKLNEALNGLSVKLNYKGIKLIVLPAPDKYDVYYDYIVDKSNFQKPFFFEHLDSMPKKYIYIDSKRILCDGIRKEKDIYFYDDTHWSPKASQLIAKELFMIINSSE